MSTKVNVAAIQMVSSHDIDENLETAKKLLQLAVEQNAKLIVLPENFLTYGNKIKPDNDQQEHFLATMSDIAREHSVWLVAGTYPISQAVIEKQTYHLDNNSFESAHVRSDKPFAASAVFDSDGLCQGIYTKVHLFDADVNDGTKRYRESDEYRHGQNIPTFTSPWGIFGVAVCYDLRFPEIFTFFQRQGCSLICLPSAFTEATGRDHWQVLVRARAIETQSFVVAPNQGGVHPKGRSTWGESMIVGPWGEVMTKIDKGEGVIVASIDFSRVDDTRRKMPVAQHRSLI